MGGISDGGEEETEEPHRAHEQSFDQDASVHVEAKVAKGSQLVFVIRGIRHEDEQVQQQLRLRVVIYSPNAEEREWGRQQSPH